MSELLAAARELPFYEDLRGLGDALFDRNAMSSTEAERALMRTFRHFEKLALVVINHGLSGRHAWRRTGRSIQARPHYRGWGGWFASGGIQEKTKPIAKAQRKTCN